MSPRGEHFKSGLTLEERFFSKVQKTASCWIWTGAKSRGYGSFTRAAKQTISAHRMSYELSRGKQPQGTHLDHVCRNKLCVNPDHLELVSPAVNILRGVGAPAINARKTHCVRGHAFTQENTYRRKDSNGRKCVECIRIQNSRRSSA